MPYIAFTSVPFMFHGKPIELYNCTNELALPLLLKGQDFSTVF